VFGCFYWQKMEGVEKEQSKLPSLDPEDTKVDQNGLH
jgi:hypothetical protein